MINKSPLQIICKITGSVFLFRGMDDKAKIKSIKNISIVWIEENEVTIDDYKELKDRMRVPRIKPHIIITTNPTTREHWSYNRFLIEEGISEEELYEQRIIKKNGIYYHHSTYKDNSFLNTDWIRNLEAEKNELLRNIKVLGRFGTVGFKVLTNISIVDNCDDINGDIYQGLDFGYAVSYNAFLQMKVVGKDLYILNEYYNRQEKLDSLFENIKQYADRVIIADSAEPRTIKELQDAGLHHIKGAKKGAGSVMEGLRKLQQFDNIYIAKTCPNCIREWQSLEHPKNDKTGLIEENKFNIDSHCFSAAIYGLEPFKHYDFKDRVSRKPIGW
jgi:phage terminase large subunit